MAETTEGSGAGQEAYMAACLDAYLGAVAAHDPTTLPLAEHVKFTENGQELPLGTGLWRTASGDGYTRLMHAADPVTGQACSLNVVTENGFAAHLAIRLGFAGRQIAEIETLVVRDRPFDFDTDALLAEDRGLETLETVMAPVDPAERRSRSELIAAVDTYFDGVMLNDGEMVEVEDGCIRLEGGQLTVLRPSAPKETTFSMGVAEQISSGRWQGITDTRRRRYTAVDEARGLVFVWVFFDCDGLLTGIDVKGVGHIELPAAEARPGSGLMAEVFKLRNGRITHIEAFFEFFAYGMKMGWEHATAHAHTTPAGERVLGVDLGSHSDP